jgi:hypothetical protein
MQQQAGGKCSWTVNIIQHHLTVTGLILWFSHQPIKEPPKVLKFFSVGKGSERYLHLFLSCLVWTYVGNHECFPTKTRYPEKLATFRT